jgi:ubiquinone/menaquinone biosynthesis C-methylase UbiE
MTELELMIDFHKNAVRQGPGSSSETLRALDFIDFSKQKNLKVADIGCGSGGPTLTLAQHLDGHIKAIDLFPDFLEILNRRAADLGVADKITTVTQSMEDLSFDQQSLDIIWSEGAIYNVGFETGVRMWRKYLKPKGYLCVSEVTWITNSRPNEIEGFWNQNYPEIDTAANKIKVLEENGFSLVGFFILSPKSWIENYYKPMEARYLPFLEKHGHSEVAMKVVQEHKEEYDLYLKYRDYYGYGFYVAQKTE